MTTPAVAAAALLAEFKSADPPPYAVFTGAGGDVAWLVKGEDGPVGYVRTGAGVQAFTDPAEWEKTTTAAGITEVGSASDVPDGAADGPPAPPAAAQPATAAVGDGGAPADPPPTSAPDSGAGAQLPDPAASTDPAAPAEPAADPADPADPAADPAPATDPLLDTEPVGPPPAGTPDLFTGLAERPAEELAAVKAALDGDDRDLQIDVLLGLLGKAVDTALETKGGMPPWLKKKGDGSDTKKGIGVGSWVAWAGNKGRVDLVVTDGTVPGVDGDHEGTKDKPMARVVVWKDGKPGGKIAAPVSSLKTTFPMKEKKAGDEPETDLELLAVEAKAAGLPGEALQTAYARGMTSWPGYARTAVHRKAWALGRAANLVKAAQEPNVPCRDRDLLAGGEL